MIKKIYKIVLYTFEESRLRPPISKIMFKVAKIETFFSQNNTKPHGKVIVCPIRPFALIVFFLSPVACYGPFRHYLKIATVDKRLNWNEQKKIRAKSKTLFTRYKLIRSIRPGLK